MVSALSPNELPVAVLFNVDPQWSAEEQQTVVDETLVLCNALRQLAHPVTEYPIRSFKELKLLLTQLNPKEQLLFNWCEDIPRIKRGEQMAARTMEKAGFVYTGSTGRAIALSEDKHAVRRRLSEAGVPVPAGLVIDTEEHLGDWDRFPAIVKSPDEHCSAGLTPESVATNPEELLHQVRHELKRRHGDAILIEDFVDGREFHVSLWGNGTIEMLPPAEMDFSALPDVHRRLCTYDSKFKPDSPDQAAIITRLPAALSPTELDLLHTTCERAYRSLDCRDYARLDLRLRDGHFYVLDVNPNPDISPDASLAMAAEYAGFNYPGFASRIVCLAALRHPEFARWVKT